MDFIISFLSTPAVLIGLVAMIGLLAQKVWNRSLDWNL